MTPALRPADKLRSRFVRRRFSLAAAIQEDAALEGLSEAEILEQVRSKVRPKFACVHLKSTRADECAWVRALEQKQMKQLRQYDEGHGCACQGLYGLCFVGLR
jgi:hypothetical protein